MEGRLPSVVALLRGGDLESCSGTFPVRWSRDGLDSGAFSVGIGGPVKRVEESILKFLFLGVSGTPGMATMDPN